MATTLGPATLAVTLYRGTAQTLRFTLTNTVDGDGTTIADVAGWTTVLTLRKRATSPDPAYFSKAGTVVGDGTSRKFKVAITAAESLTLKAGDYEASFERTNAGSEDLLALGTITVAYDIKNPK